MFEVVVDKDKCTGDEECVAACPAQVFEMVDGKADPVEADECLGCETCVDHFNRVHTIFQGFFCNLPGGLLILIQNGLGSFLQPF